MSATIPPLAGHAVVVIDAARMLCRCECGNASTLRSAKVEHIEAAYRDAGCTA